MKASSISNAAVIKSEISGKIVRIIGYILGAISILAFFGFLVGDSKVEFGTIVFDFIILSIGIILVVKGFQIKKRISRFKSYIAFISGKQINSIEKIAASTLQSTEFVRHDLQKMIEKKFLTNAAIDLATNEIIIGSKDAIQAQVVTQYEMETYKCPSCGASGKKQKGVLIICDYCGSHLK